ncbi:MAG: hypothetical protein C5B46_03990 [Proteobacteria bacterium]|nr:MAG: hypothetical protein C5B46_03990 [Pseudomonadota bacterium]
MSQASVRPSISLNNVLVATDLSRDSETAVRVAMGVARRYESALTFFNCIDPTLYNFAGPDAATQGADATLRDLEQYRDDLASRGLFKGVRTNAIVRSGEITEVLDVLVEEQNAGLIVAGARGRTGLNKAMLGSTAEKIFRNARCPVLMIGPDHRAQVRQSDPRSILFATDLTFQSSLAQAYAFSLAEKYRAELTVVHALSHRREGETVGFDSRHETHLQQMKQLTGHEPLLSKAPRFMVDFGSPAEIILKTAVRLKSEMIVLGVREPHQLRDRLHSSVAYQVVCASNAAVLTVRG